MFNVTYSLNRLSKMYVKPFLHVWICHGAKIQLIDCSTSAWTFFYIWKYIYIHLLCQNKANCNIGECNMQKRTSGLWNNATSLVTVSPYDELSRSIFLSSVCSGKKHRETALHYWFILRFHWTCVFTLSLKQTSRSSVMLATINVDSLPNSLLVILKSKVY